MADRQCSRCGEFKTPEFFRVDSRRDRPRAYCRACENASRDRTGQYSRMTPEQRKAQNRRIYEYRKRTRSWTTNPKERAARIEQKRRARVRRAAASGREYRPRPTGGAAVYRRTMWEQNARQAWAWWLKNAPDAWVAAYWQSMGKPWKNPRLSVSDAYRIRYNLDHEFYAREYARLQNKKVRHRSILSRAAGGMSSAEIRLIREQHEHCAYCNAWLEYRFRTLDHVVPLAKGGKHEVSNVVIACRPCNSRKGAKDFLKVLPEHRARVAIGAQDIASSRAPRRETIPWLKSY